MIRAGMILDIACFLSWMKGHDNGRGAGDQLGGALRLILLAC